MELETESLTISTPRLHTGMQCKNDFSSPIRSDQLQCNTRLSLTLLRGRIRALHACMGTQRWGNGGRGVDVYLYASFLFSSLCLCLPNRSGYGYQADTRAALGSTYLFPEMAPLYFFFFFLASLIKAILIRSFMPSLTFRSSTVCLQTGFWLFWCSHSIPMGKNVIVS